MKQIIILSILLVSHGSLNHVPSIWHPLTYGLTQLKNILSTETEHRQLSDPPKPTNAND